MALEVHLISVVEDVKFRLRLIVHYCNSRYYFSDTHLSVRDSEHFSVSGRNFHFGRSLVHTEDWGASLRNTCTVVPTLTFIAGVQA